MDQKINKTSLDKEFTADIIFDALSESYGSETILGVLKFHKKTKEDLLDDDFRRSILQLLEEIN